MNSRETRDQKGRRGETQGTEAWETRSVRMRTDMNVIGNRRYKRNIRSIRESCESEHEKGKGEVRDARGNARS